MSKKLDKGWRPEDKDYAPARLTLKQKRELEVQELFKRGRDTHRINYNEITEAMEVVEL